jgi:hypothetical protein
MRRTPLHLVTALRHQTFIALADLMRRFVPGSTTSTTAR